MSTTTLPNSNFSQYFESTFCDKWSPRNFIKWASGRFSPALSPQQAGWAFAAELDKIVNAEGAYRDSPRSWYLRAYQLRVRKRKQGGSDKIVRVKKVYAPVQKTIYKTLQPKMMSLTSHQHSSGAGALNVVQSGIGSATIAPSVHPPFDGLPTTHNVEPASVPDGSALGEEATVPGDSDETPVNAASPATTSTDFVLGSGTDLNALVEQLLEFPQDTDTAELLEDVRNGILFPHHLRDVLRKSDVAELFAMGPQAVALPDDFTRYVALLEKAAGETRNGWLRYTTPDEINSTGADFDVLCMWQYVSCAYGEMHLHLQHLKVTSPKAGELWLDLNVWSFVVDKAFKGAKEMFLNRRELAPLSGSCDKSDGIVRSFSAPVCRQRSRRLRLDLGFVEVKPERVPYAVDYRKDHRKLLRMMVESLESMRRMVRDEEVASKLVVIGILCIGFEITFYNATSPMPGVYVVSDVGHELTLDTLGRVLTECWRARETTASTYQQIVKALERA